LNNKNVVNRHNNFVRKILAMKMVFTPEQKIFIIQCYFRNGHTIQRKPGSGRPKVRTEENIETVQRQMEDEPQLSLRQLSQQTERAHSNSSLTYFLS
jgi:transposase-like protein